VACHAVNTTSYDDRAQHMLFIKAIYLGSLKDTVQDLVGEV
jgi:hypothetical protein